jgi:cell wall assembly regulator SMI1
MNMTFDELRTLLNRSGPLEVGKGATKAEIEAAEQALGVSIRGDYRGFVQEYGWGGVGYIELYGLGDDVPPHLNLVDITQSERTEMSPCLRTELLPIMNDGGGNLYCLDTKPDGPKVVFWDHEDTADQAPVVDAPDFSAWLASKLAGM